MRQSLVKGTRRDIRRAIGPAALQSMQDIEQAISIMQAGLAACQREIATLAVHHADQKRHTDALSGRLNTFNQQTATFWKRLCWFFCE